MKLVSIINNPSRMINSGTLHSDRDFAYLAIIPNSVNFGSFSHKFHADAQLIQHFTHNRQVITI